MYLNVSVHVMYTVIYIIQQKKLQRSLLNILQHNIRDNSIEKAQQQQMT